ncbi:MAG: hypothetical protein ACNYZG_02475 [Gammaproteobacteria bacterium]
MKNYSVIIMLFLCVLPMLVNADDDEWEALKDVENLQKFMDGLIVERPLTQGEKSKAEFFSDGTSLLQTWGGTFFRTWEINDDAQVCVTNNFKTACYIFERNIKKTEQFRTYSSEDDKYTEFSTIDGRTFSELKFYPATSMGSASTVSAQEMAAELSNPNTPVSIMNTNFDYTRYDGNLPGASNQSGFSVLFQPSIPYPLGGGKNFFIRPSIPFIIDQPVFNSVSNEFESEEGELGDIGLDASFGFTFDADGGNNIMLVGASLIMPTATGDLGQDQWQLGPFFGGSMIRKWGSVAVFASQLVDVAGDQSFDTNITAGQYFYSVNLNDGWQIIGTPTWSYDFEASSNNAASFPLAIGIAKTAIINSRPWQFTLEYWNYVLRPDEFGVEHQIRVTIGPVVKLPWKKR